MPTFSPAFAHPGQLDKEIKKAIRKLDKNDVISVNYSIHEDSTDDLAIFFRVLLTDAAAGREDQLGELGRRISTTVLDVVRPHENWGLLAYFSYRSESEQAQRKDSKWP